jgi:hypothetical protein
MQRHAAIRRVRPRRAIATLEFVMALPVLLLLMVGITWLGFSVIARTEVLVQARAKAWKKRFDNSAQKPLVFPAGLVVAKNPFYSTESDYVTESATKSVSVSPVFKAVPAPKATHTILSGSWDHRAMKMDKPPNFELYLKAVANAATKDIQTQLGNLTNLVNGLDQIGAAAIAQAFSQGSSFNGMSSSPNSAAKTAERETKQREKAEKDQLQQRLKDLGGMVHPLTQKVVPIPNGQLDETIDEIYRREAELSAKYKQTPDKDEQREKQRQAELDKLERELQLLKDKRQRLESEINDIVEELKAFRD